MRWWKGARWLFASIAAGALASVPVSTVLACSCAMSTLTDSLGFSDVAFTGTVSNVGQPPRPGGIVSSMDPVNYAFAVDAVYKGSITDASIVASTAMDGASCGTSFGIDERWLVFGNLDDGAIWTTLCSGNVLITDPDIEAQIAAELGEPIAVPEPGSGNEPPFEVALALLLAGTALVAVIGVSAWAFLRDPGRAS